ncbi:CU044_5270 family protein [Actinomadura opuntiae]|uniref:CU044_5270 family protein n=1 Tax=Actinomadura sp. OS1-43 TaxID=604315 RepID=UPI00255ABD61|nr:CU044_5270 family protein [Actinomadura sp. OS1-43]MDL4815602.1 CU044_5270 family protein [Actinomadura sp. OS1-43]
MNELDLLRAAQPDVPAPSREALDATLTWILADVPDPTPARPPRTRRVALPRPGRRTLLAGGLAAAAAVAIGVVPVLGGHGAAPAEAAVVLRRAAAATRVGLDTVARPGQWIYVESTERGVPGQGVMWAPGEDADTPRPTTSFHIRSWYPATGGKIRDCGPGGDRGGWCAVVPATVIRQVNGREEKLALLPDQHGWDPDDEEFVRSLPTDPALLRARVYAQADEKSFLEGFDRDQAAVETIADLMQGHLPRNLRAALYDVLARVPGVRLDGDAVDGAGRRGIGFARTGQGENLQIVVARGSYRYLGDRLTAVRNLSGGVGAGTVLRWSAQLRVAVVDAPRQRPS